MQPLPPQVRICCKTTCWKGNLMIKHSVSAAGLVLATALAGAVVSAAPAHAAESGTEGRVTAKANLSVRYGPTTASRAVGSVRPGQVIPLVCKVRGSSVDGNDLWYALPPTLNEWVSARYVANVGSAPEWCGTDARFRGRTTAALIQRTGPTRAASSAGTVPRGAALVIVCKLRGQDVNGNALWYSLANGRWVSARYVTNVGQAPGWCN
jgi:uncharacterized protein YraI